MAGTAGTYTFATDPPATPKPATPPKPPAAPGAYRFADEPSPAPAATASPAPAAPAYRLVDDTPAPRATVAAGLGYNNASERTDLLTDKTSPLLVAALRAAENGGYKLQVTSVRSDHHDDGPAGHAGGHAADIGAINGITVGPNDTTRNFLSAIMATKTLSKIGTIKALATDPRLLAAARLYGVTLFTDEGTGPHVHLQVAGTPAPPPNAPKTLADHRAAAQKQPTYTFANPMDEANSNTTMPGGTDIPTQVHSALSTIAGHQDLPFILGNASARDGTPVWTGLQDPHSYVSQAWALYKRDPVAAMDEYGLGSPKQNEYMAQHGDQYGAFMQTHPRTNAAITMIEEFANPMALVEGGLAGRALGPLARGIHDADLGVHVPGATGLGREVEERTGLGDPAYGHMQDGKRVGNIIGRAGDNEATTWRDATVATIRKADTDQNKMVIGTIFKGLTPEEQTAYHQLRRLTELDFKLRTDSVRKVVFNQATRGLPAADKQTLAQAFARGVEPEIPQAAARAKVVTPGGKQSIASRTRAINEQGEPVYRYQQTPGAMEVNPTRGGTFVSRGEHGADFLSTNPRGGMGGPNQIRGMLDARNPLDLPQGRLALRALERLSPKTLERLFGERDEVAAQRYAKALGIDLTALGWKGGHAPSEVVDRIAAMYARKAGHDVIRNPREAFVLDPEALRSGERPHVEMPSYTMPIANAAEIERMTRLNKLYHQIGLEVETRMPRREDYMRAGDNEATTWRDATVATIRKADTDQNKMVIGTIFKGLTPEEQTEVGRLSQGLKPNPLYFAKSGELYKRADMLRAYVAHVTNEQIRTGHLRPTTTKTVMGPQVGSMTPPKPTTVVDRAGNVSDVSKYLPMSHSYDFGEQHELISRLQRGTQSGGGGNTMRRPKAFDDLDQSAASGLLSKDFSLAENVSTWARQRLQNVAFDDALARAPSSLRLDSTPATRAALKASTEGQAPGAVGTIGGKPYLKVIGKGGIVPRGNKTILSPTLRKSLVAPEFWEFLTNNDSFQKYLGQGSTLPGEAQTRGGRFVSAMRSVFLLNPIWHPGINVAANDAVSRGLNNLGGPVWEAGGWGYNAAKAAALQLNLRKPEDFIGGAEQYSKWMDRALKAGALAEFGPGRTTMLGGSRARVMTEPVQGIGPKAWVRRLDKAWTKVSDANLDRTFGEKGEGAFATSLFKDAVERGGLSDVDAAALVRKAFTDYYSIDPTNKWSSAVLFMPWLKGNTKFWANALVRKPQYVTGPVHAIRDYNQQQGDPAMDKPYAPPDFRVFGNIGNVVTGSKPDPDQPEYWTPPFVGRDIAHIANITQALVQGQPTEVLQNADQMIEGRANPFSRFAADALVTSAAHFMPGMHGPENNWHMIVNDKAPDHEQLLQVGRYAVAYFVPVPLVGYAIQDAMRRGMNGEDLQTALVAAAGGGYGSASLSDAQRKTVSRAQRNYLKFYYANRNDQEALGQAWSDYVDQLQGAGVLH